MKPPNVGELKHLATFRKMLEGRGSDGSVTETPTTLKTAWVRMTPLGGSEKYLAQGISASVVYEVWARWFAGLTAQCDFTVGTREFDIQSVRNFDESNRWWIITATEGK